MTTITSEHRIPSAALDTLEVKLNRLNKRAAKLGTAPIIVRTLRTEQETRKSDIGFESIVEFSIIEVTGETPVINGYEFAATLEHVTFDDGESAVIVRSIPGVELPARFRDATPDYCDHCKKIRQRNDTFVVHHIESDEYRQVGRNCLADFIGTENPNQIAAQAEAQLGFFEWIASDGPEGWTQNPGGKFVNKISTDSALAWTVAACDKHGWLSRGKAQEIGETATADRVLNMQSHLQRCRNGWRCGDHFSPGKVEEEKAAEILDFCRESLANKIEYFRNRGDEPSEYIWNLYVALRQGAIQDRQFGLVASAYAYWQRETGKLAERIAQREREAAEKGSKVNEYFGKVGDKVELNLILVGERSFFGDYGEVMIETFEDSDGRCFVWWNSGRSELKVGTKYAVKGTVKSHSEFKGTLQTNLSRCKAIVSK